MGEYKSPIVYSNIMKGVLNNKNMRTSRIKKATLVGVESTNESYILKYSVLKYNNKEIYYVNTDDCISACTMGVNMRPVSFMANDLKSAFPEYKYRIIELFDLFVLPAYRNRGLATKIIKEVCDKYSDYIITTNVAVSCKEYSTEPSHEDVGKIIRSLIPFYNKCGFQSINNLVDYQYREACLYTGNSIGKEIYDRINKIVKEN